MLGHIQKYFIDLNAMICAFLFYMMTNIFVMYVMCRKKLELLRKTFANDGQPQEKDDYEKVVVQIFLKGLWEPHGALSMR
jgi:hypothetical protein